jgi:hypothetical protein
MSTLARDEKYLAREQEKAASRAKWLARTNPLEAARVERRTDGAATATLVLGILSFFFGPLALVAFITSHFGTRNGSRTAGLVCAWIAVVLTSVAVAYIIYAMNKVGGFNPNGYSTDSSFVTP